MTAGSWKELRFLSPPGRLPLRCQELYFAYLMNASSDAFERFYEETKDLFYSYAVERCAAAGGDVDPQEVVNRLYGTLVTYAANHRRIPVRALLSWCLGTLANLVHAEKRAKVRPTLPVDALGDRASACDPLDQLIEAEERGARRRLYDRIMDLVHRPNPLLSARERKILHLFYCEGRSIRSVAAACRVRPDHVAVLLHRARRKIAARFRRKERPEGVSTPKASAPGGRSGIPPAWCRASGP